MFALIRFLNGSGDILNPLYKKLGKKPEKQSIDMFLKSFNDSDLNKINDLYQKITFYKADKNDIKMLKKLIKNYIKKN